MPQPDISDVHVNGLLTDMSIAHMNAEEHYVADRVFAPVPSDKQSDIYLKYTRGVFFQGSENAAALDALARAPGTNASEAGYTTDLTNTFFCQNFAVAVPIPDELRGNADPVFDLDNEATLLATQINLIRRERGFSADFMNTGVWGTDVVGTTNFTKWSDYGASDPFTDLENGIDTIEGAVGMRPNKLVMGAIVWRRLKHHPDFIDRIKGGATAGSPAQLTRQLLASLLEIDEVLIGRASYRSSAEGAALTLARIVDDDALLLYAPPNVGKYTPAAGKTFYWKPLTGGNIQFARKIREERPRRDIVEVHSYWDQVATETAAGYFLSDAVD